MSILLAVAALVAAASALHVSASFRKRAQNIAEPLIERLRRELSVEIGSGDEDARRALREVAGSLASASSVWRTTASSCDPRWRARMRDRS